MLPYLRGKVNTNGAVEDDFFLWAARQGVRHIAQRLAGSFFVSIQQKYGKDTVTSIRSLQIPEAEERIVDIYSTIWYLCIDNNVLIINHY